jgi:hypothetical protein
MDDTPAHPPTAPEQDAQKAHIYVNIKGDNFGPYTAQELALYVREKKILHQDLAWMNGMEGWVKVEDLLRLGGEHPDERSAAEAQEAAQAQSGGKEKRKTKASKLDAETIRHTTKSGATALHNAVKNGTFNDIQPELVTVELLLLQDNNGETALHYAARKRCLTDIPLHLFTWETLTVTDNRGRTPLHAAVQYGCIDQIPSPPLSEDVLAFPTSDQAQNSVVHVAAQFNRLGLIPHELLTKRLLKQPNAQGQTPQDILDANKPTEKQIAYLRDLGASCDEATLTKFEASCLIDATLEERRRTTPPSEAQMQKLNRLGIADELPDNPTSQDAHDLLDEVLEGPVTENQIKELKESGVKLKNVERMTAGELDDLIKLASRTPDEDDLMMLRHYRLTLQEGNALSVRLVVELIGHLNGYEFDIDEAMIARACVKAMNDPAFATPTLSCEGEGCGIDITWPQSKLREWSRG